METAERAVKELSGMTVMGRPIRLDLEGPKKPSREEGEGGAPRSGSRGARRGSFGGSDGGGRNRDRDRDRDRDTGRGRGWDKQ